MRGAGGWGGPATTGGTAGRDTIGICGADDAVIEGAAGVGDATTATGGEGGAAGRGGCTAAGGAGWATGAGAGLSAAGGATTGRATGACKTGADSGPDGAGAAGATGLGGGGATTGFAATGAAANGGRTGGAAAASFFWVIALNTSPGREMCDKSILVLISSSPRSVRAERADEPCASAEPWMWARTFSASWSSSELEWVFFSVTPTSGSASRMALLLTSSSLARSLIRTLLIRPFFSPR